MGYQIITDAFLEALDDEFKKACHKFKPFNSSHEAFAVIQEEVDEFWEEVKKKKEERDPAKMLKELIQIAAMARRSANDLGLLGDKPSYIYAIEHVTPASGIPTAKGIAEHLTPPTES
jgi:hypothetical protein